MTGNSVSRRVFLGEVLAMTGGASVSARDRASARSRPADHLVKPAPAALSRSERNPTPTIILIAGLGADGRVFDPQRALPYPIVTVEWIEPKSRETLAAYAQRLSNSLNVPRPYLLGGMSMGGMLALEMSRYLQPEALFLIASGRSSAALKPVYRVAGRALGAVPFWGELPRCLSDPLARSIARNLLPSRNDLTAEQTEFCVALSTSCSPQFVRWGCRAVTTWPGLERIEVPVHHIHGERDRMIPLRRVRPDHVVRGGGHLINITHADEVNRFLEERIMTEMQRQGRMR